MSAGGEKIKISVRGLSVAYGGVTALKGLDLDIQAGEILSIIGPSNSGKTSFLRSLNRMNELEPPCPDDRNRPPRRRRHRQGDIG